MIDLQHIFAHFTLFEWFWHLAALCQCYKATDPIPTSQADSACEHVMHLNLTSSQLSLVWYYNYLPVYSNQGKNSSRYIKLSQACQQDVV